MPESPTTPFSGIFVSYRRDDSSGHAGRLSDKLVDHFGKNRIFRDVDTIELGDDFVEAIENAIGSCAVLIAIIGRDWLSRPGETTRRLDNPNDFVRIEIANALSRNIPVIPVLVQKATMPNAEDLPEDLSKLVRRNALEISDRHWQLEVDELVSVLERILTKREDAIRLASLATPRRKGGEVMTRPTPTPDSRKTPTTKRSTSTKSANSLRTNRPAKSVIDRGKAAEMRFWNSIKESANPDDFKEYLKKYLDGEFEGLAQIRLRSLESAKAKRTPSPDSKSKATKTQPKSPTVAASPAEPKAGTVVRNQIGMELVLIPPGRFMMGLAKHCMSAEKPVHEVTINYSFYMGKYQVTQAQWQAVMGNNPSYFKDCGGNCPVEQVSWNDAQRFINKLNKTNDGFEYRLPTEEEWEYACRAGTTTLFAFGDSLSQDQANCAGEFNGTGRESTTPAGSFQPNAFGIFDMHGNVYEWCEDWFEPYEGDGPLWVQRLKDKQTSRVLRGGSFQTAVSNVRSGSRYGDRPGRRTELCGVRIVAVARTQ